MRPDRCSSRLRVDNRSREVLRFVVTGSVSQGYTVTLTAGVDTTTTPTGGGMAGAPAGPPPSR